MQEKVQRRLEQKWKRNISRRCATWFASHANEITRCPGRGAGYPKVDVVALLSLVDGPPMSTSPRPAWTVHTTDPDPSRPASPAWSGARQAAIMPHSSSVHGHEACPCQAAMR